MSTSEENRPMKLDQLLNILQKIVDADKRSLDKDVKLSIDNCAGSLYEVGDGSHYVTLCN